jgi:hypothetical protein
MAIKNLPLIPQQDHRETKYHPQDGAANVIHVFFFPSGEGVKREKRVCWGGTGSWPPAHQG